jgi:lipopolysaccharide/colanic/teichoic acid biosynthesis glycosyltransferase
MSIVNKKEAIVLFLGDIIFLAVSLWLTLLVRELEIPTSEYFNYHVFPFSILFVFWLIIFYIAGLYEKHTLILRNSLPNVLFNTQIINSIIAITFFYFIPYFKIQPKTTLFIYLIVSMGFIFLWRLVVFNFFAPKRKDKAIMIGAGEEMGELYHEVNNNHFYSFVFAEALNAEESDTSNFDQKILTAMDSKEISLIVADLYDHDITKSLPSLHESIFADVRFVDIYELYESIFNRLPVSLLDYNWFFQNISKKDHMIYDFVKRSVDFVSALGLGIISLIVYPFVLVAIKVDDGGSLFYFDERIGEKGKVFKLVKFRSMTKKDGGVGAISAVGKFLRKSRIDELPQLWNVVKGDLSLIGPRPERTDLTQVYIKSMPFYNVRHIIKPGLAGWAQLRQENHPHHGADTEATEEKLSYDLYYIKNRSFWLDLKIALQTLKILISQKGR